MQAKVSGVSSVSPYLPVRIRMPCGMARVVTTASVCGNTLSSTNTTLAPNFCISRGRRAYIIVTASAAAVASSRSEQLPISMPVSEITAVWKLSSASRRPCEISA